MNDAGADATCQYDVCFYMGCRKEGYCSLKVDGPYTKLHAMYPQKKYRWRLVIILTL